MLPTIKLDTAPDSTQPDQYARFVKTARALGRNDDETAFDESLKAVLWSGKSTDAQVLDALEGAIQLGKMRAQRSRAMISDCEAVIAEAHKVMAGQT